MDNVIQTKKNKVKATLAKAAALGMAASSVVSMTAATAFAGGFNDSVTVKTDSPDAASMMGRIIGILLTITRFVGVALIVYGVYEIVMSFMQNQPEAKTKGVIMALAGVVMTALKSILKSMNVIG